MEQFDNHDLQYMLQDYNDEANFDDDYFLPAADDGSVDGYLDSDFDDDFELGKSKNDTSALEARNGKDIQGIPWERFNLTRDMYRDSRLKLYKNYESLSQSRESLAKECKAVEIGHDFYDFQFNTRLVKSTIVHFQAAPGSSSFGPGHHYTLDKYHAIYLNYKAVSGMYNLELYETAASYWMLYKR